MANLSPDQRLHRAVTAIMRKEELADLRPLMLYGERTLRDDIPTACTNGRDEYYSPAFIATLSDAELRFLVLHEVFHKLGRHLLVYPHLNKIDPGSANIAMDHWVNLTITDNYGGLANEANNGPFVSMPEGGMRDSKYSGWDIPKIFKDIREDSDSGDSGNSGSGNSGSGDSGDGGFDQHDWDAANSLTEEEKAQIREDIYKALRQGKLIASKTGSGGTRVVDKALEPVVDWRKELRAFVTETCRGSDYSSWSRPKRRYAASGVFMPETFSENMKELVLAVDTSGSIREELPRFFGEIVDICKTCKPQKLHLLYWDTQVCQYETYQTHEYEQLLSTTSPKGGGGTSVTCVPKYLETHRIDASAVVVFTDGYVSGGWGQWRHPLLWVICDNKRAMPDVGKVVHVESK